MCYTLYVRRACSDILVLVRQLISHASGVRVCSYPSERSCECEYAFGVRV